MQYQWREGARFRGSAQEAGEEIERLRAVYGEKLRPRDVVAEAREKSSPLHGHFTWDNTEAADAYRRAQARQLIGSVLIIYDDPGAPSEPTRAFVSVNSEGSPTYRTMREVIESETFSHIVIRDVVLAIESALRRGKNFAQLSAAMAHLQAAREMVREAAQAWEAHRPTVTEPPPRRRRPPGEGRAVAKRATRRKR